MAITDLELAQATIEFVGGFVSALLAVIILINRHKETSIKQIVKMLFITSALFVFDGFAYLFRGNTNPFSLFMTRLSNLSVFFLNMLLLSVFIGYLYSILQERNAAPGDIYRKIVRFGFWAAVAILAVNLFTGWMYTFDEQNYYHRGWGWYVYTGLSLMCLFTSCTLILRYRSTLDRFTRFSLLLFELIPILAIVLQSVIYGISITNIGIGISIVLVLVAYLINWNRTSVSDKLSVVQIRRSYDIAVLFIIMVISISASIISCILSIWNISEEVSLQSSQVIAHVVNDRLENLFLRPITVTETMAKDYSLQKYMIHSSNPKYRSTEAEMSAYLESIRSGFDYQKVYAVCETSRAYYTYNGFIKTVDPENDPTDAWYKEFIASGRNYTLQVDTDAANHWDWSVFVNHSVLDSSGNLLGVCGIGIDLTELQHQLSTFEDHYSLRISLADRSGQAIVTSQDVQVGQGLLDDAAAEAVGTEAFSIQEQSGSRRMTKLMKELDWYLIIEDLAPERASIAKIIIPNVVIFLAGLFMLVVAFCVITIRERKIALELAEKRRTSLSDELTGLSNRRALQLDLKQIEQAGTLPEFTFIIMDLNELKQNNDTLGHQAGDELIRGTAQCMAQAMGGYGKLYRTGGDEFVAILCCTQEDLENVLAEFDRLASSWRRGKVGPISISRGVVRCQEFPQLTAGEILDLADRRMYEDKKRYYIASGKARRI